MSDSPPSGLWRLLTRFVTPSDTQTLLDLREAAASLRQQGNHFAAAYAMKKATDAAWGDPKEMQTCALAAVRDYQQVPDSGEPCALESLTGETSELRR